MTNIPTNISAEVNGNDLKGIIYKIKNTLGISNPISKNIVIPRAVGDSEGIIDSLVLWDSNYYTSKRVADSWVQLSFPGRFIRVTPIEIREHMQDPSNK